MENKLLTGQIIKCAMKVHSVLGPGLLESVYRTCLCHELTKNGLAVVREKWVPIISGDLVIAKGLRLDVLVENTVVVEVKAVERMKELFSWQLLSYLTLGRVRTGLLINFNVRHLRHGIKRIVR